MQSHNTEHNKTATILFAHFGGECIRGSERCLLDLLTHLDKSRFKAVVWCNSNTMTNEIRRMNIDVIQCDFPRLFKQQHYRSPIRQYLAMVRKAIELIDLYDIKLIHANSSIPTQFLNFVARARHLPLISHLHSRNNLRERVTNGLHQVAMVVGVSKPVTEQLLQDGMRSERTCVIPNGVDTQLFMSQPAVNIRSQLNISANDFVIATTGSLIYRKGVDVIIEAVSRLIMQGLPVKFVIIGEGPEKNKLKQQVQKLGITESIIFLGERNDVSGLLRGGVDLYVSATREEAFGLALAEASFAELAVIAPDTGGISEVIIDGKTGKLYPGGDVAILCEHILTFYRSPFLRQQMGKAGRQHIYDNLTIQHNVERFQQLYSNMLSDPAMHMKWHSHWQWLGTFNRISRQVIDTKRTKFYRVADI